MNDSLYVRARLSLAIAGQETADLARGVVGDVSTPMGPVERIKKARRVRLMSLTMVDRVVLAALSEGASWEQVAEGLGIDPEKAQQRYASTWADWVAGDTDDEDDFGDYGVGMRGDTDLAGTAEALDQWWRRHAEPYETVIPNPVSQALVDGQASPGDSQGV